MTVLQRALARTRQHAGIRGTALRAVLPAPVLGLNTLDPESAMEELYATRMINWFPDHGRVVTRRGSATWSDIDEITGDTHGLIGTLHTWTNGDDEKLFAFTRSAVFDVSTKGAAVQVRDTGISSSRWSGANMNGNAILVNGADAPLRVGIDGAFTPHGLSGATGENLDVADLSTVQVHRGRLYFTEKDSSKFWYGAADSVSGELESFDLSGVEGGGGSLLAIGTLSADTGAGADDFLAFFMERGQVILYSGGDPGGDDWRLNGVYLLAPVIGRRPLVKLANDVIAITEDGYLPVGKYLAAGPENDRLALSNKITPTVKNAIDLYSGSDGWQGLYYGKANWLIFNVGGRGGGRGLQQVMNTNSGAWTEFQGMPAECWEEFRGRLFFGSGDGLVVEANVAGDDNGQRIQYSVQSAYSYMNNLYAKHITLIRPQFLSRDATVDIEFGLNADFSPDTPDLQSIRLEGGGSTWEGLTWENWEWSRGDVAFREWRPPSALGGAVAIVVSCSLEGGEVSWFATDIEFDVLRGLIG